MMHGMDKSCRLAGQDKGGGGLSADTEQLLGPRPAGSVEQRHDVGTVAWNCSVLCPVDHGNGGEFAKSEAGCMSIGCRGATRTA
jgi:hypothetical protein